MSLDDVKRRILARVSLAALIGETVALTTRSGRPTGCCPFHAEKSPSFVLYDDRYYCFGCKATGDAIEFVRQMQGMGYVEALRHLAGKFGVEAPELDEARGRSGQHRADASVYKMMMEAQEFYQALLHEPSPQAISTRDYLHGRGYTEQGIKDAGFGMTPVESFGLVKYLRHKGYREEDMIEASLASPSTSGGRAYDFLRQRLTIPIRDPQGRVIAFGGRTLANDPAKYKNSRETRLFEKSHTLFNFDKARSSMRERGRAIVVEGYMDALALREAGFPETVACLGTAFTESHLALLKRATGMVVLLFDGDNAGRKATLASVNVTLSAPDVLVRAVHLPEGFDPDDFVRQRGADALTALISTARPLLDVAVEQRLKMAEGLSVPELINNEFVPWLARLSDPIQRDFLATRIAQLAGVDRAHILGKLATLGGGSRSPAQVAAARAGATVRAGAEPPPAEPLSPSATELIGHIYYAVPGEVPLEDVRAFVKAELELPSSVLAFVTEMLTMNERGIAPHSQETGAFHSAAAGEIVALIERLVRAKTAYVTTDRAQSIGRVLTHWRTLRVKGTIATLRAQVARLGASQGAGPEVIQLLKTIKELTGELGRLGSS